VVRQAAMRQKRDLQRRMRGILAQSMPNRRAECVATTLFMLIEGATVLARMGQGEVALDGARKTAADILAAETVR
jgi:hypothetical protein